MKKPRSKKSSKIVDFNIPSPIDGSPNGNSTEALTNTDFSLVANKERTAELLHGLLRDMAQGKDIKPFIIASKDGMPIVQELKIDDDGTLILPKIKMNSKEDIELKSKTVRRILKHISPVLRAEIENVTYIALMRKDVDKLKDIMVNVKIKNLPVKVENRIGCIWLIIGDYEFVI